MTCGTPATEVRAVAFDQDVPSAELLHRPLIARRPTDPEDVPALLDAHLVNLAGAYGDPAAGDPIQYDHLRVEHERGAVEITICNRAILLFTTDSDAVRRIHQVCCRLDDLRAGRSLT